MSKWSNEQRIAKEHEVVKKYLQAILDAGYLICGFDSEGEELFAMSGVMPSDNDLFACDDLHVTVYEEKERRGFLYFVFGNEPGEVLNDYATRIEPIVQPINEWADQFC